MLVYHLDLENYQKLILELGLQLPPPLMAYTNIYAHNTSKKVSWYGQMIALSFVFA